MHDPIVVFALLYHSVHPDVQSLRYETSSAKPLRSSTHTYSSYFLFSGCFGSSSPPVASPSGNSSLYRNSRTRGRARKPSIVLLLRIVYPSVRLVGLRESIQPQSCVRCALPQNCGHAHVLSAQRYVYRRLRLRYFERTVAEGPSSHNLALDLMKVRCDIYQAYPHDGVLESLFHWVGAPHLSPTSPDRGGAAVELQLFDLLFQQVDTLLVPVPDRGIILPHVICMLIPSTRRPSSPLSQRFGSGEDRDRWR